MRKVWIFLLIVTLMLSVCACGDSDYSYDDDSDYSYDDDSDYSYDDDSDYSYDDDSDYSYDDDSDYSYDDDSDYSYDSDDDYDYDKGYGYTAPHEGESLDDYIKRQDPELYESMQDNWDSWQ